MLSSRSIMVGYRAEVRDRLAIQIPHRRGDRVIVRVDEMPAHIAVAGEMELPHAFPRDGRSSSSSGSKP